MDVIKVPPVPPPSKPTAGPPANAPASGDSLATGAGASVAPLPDRLAISSLDLPAALQILLAEVRSALLDEIPPMPLAGPRPVPGPLVVPGPSAAPGVGAVVGVGGAVAGVGGAVAGVGGAVAGVGDAPALIAGAAMVAPPVAVIDVFLRALPPPSADAAEWSAAATRTEHNLQVALERGLATVAAWRNVPPEVMEGAKKMQTQVLGLIVEEPPSPLWLNPEWVGLKPRIEHYWRRRRRALRRLSDPDYTDWPQDPGAEQTEG